MDKESVVLGCGCEVFGDEAEELKQRFRLLRLLIVSTALSMPLLWDLPPRFQFVLATVLQFGPGLYFIRNAIRGLKSRSLGMDMLVALSTTAIYVYSTVVVFTVTENIKLYYLCDGVLISLPSLPGEQNAVCRLPERLRRQTPLLVGLLTGFMPCGALYAAWLCAMSSGSAAKGALLMLAFALGTVPLMLLFASLGALLPRGWTKYLRKLGAVLVTSMGLKMLVGGLLLLRG